MRQSSSPIGIVSSRDNERRVGRTPTRFSTILAELHICKMSSNVVLKYDFLHENMQTDFEMQDSLQDAYTQLFRLIVSNVYYRQLVSTNRIDVRRHTLRYEWKSTSHW